MFIRWFIMLALLCMGLGAQGRANMSVRLLSCNDLASAKELSQLVKDRIIYASDGWVELFEDGTIASQNVFKKIVNGAEKETLAKYTSTSDKAKVRLGDDVISNIDGFDDLLKNDYFKSTFENLDKGLLIRKFAQYNVTFAEEAALKLFVQDGYYRNFNKALSGTIPMTKEYEAMKELMLKACNKLPKLDGINVYRGAGKSESIFAKKLKIGDFFDFEGRFTSSSFDQSEAYTFMRGGYGDVIWVIASKTGRDLTKINSSEEEILFSPFIKYKLIDIDATNPDVLIYKIVEQ